MSATTRTTIDGAGRIVVPKAVREAAGLLPHDEIEVRLAADGAIELRAVPRSMRMEDRGGITVAVPVEPLPALTDDVVSGVRRSLRDAGGGAPER